MFRMTGRVKPCYIQLVKQYFETGIWDLDDPVMIDWVKYMENKDWSRICHPANAKTAIDDEGNFEFSGEWSIYFPLMTMKILIWDKICHDISSFIPYIA